MHKRGLTHPSASFFGSTPSARSARLARLAHAPVPMETIICFYMLVRFEFHGRPCDTCVPTGKHARVSNAAAPPELREAMDSAREGTCDAAELEKLAAPFLIEAPIRSLDSVCEIIKVFLPCPLFQ